MIVASVAALVGVVWGVQAMSAPVERAGEPTVAVPAPTGTRFATASPTPSTSASASASGKPSASASASPVPKSTMKASGDFDWSKATASATGSQGKLHSFVVGVETTAKLNADSTANTIAGVLNDPRSWTGDGDVRFALVGKSKATVNLYLASGKTAAVLCGSAAAGAYTCTKGDMVVINAERWKSGAATFPGDKTGYRAYLVNHAIGQLLGRKSASCGGKGKKAPVMMQQSTDLRGCLANPWP